MSLTFLRKYGESATINFPLYGIDGVDLKADATFAAGDVKIMKDEGAEANTTNLPTDEGQGYSLVLTAAEATAARVVIYLVDAATKVWLDEVVVIETYGHASAQHAFDLDTAAPSVNVTQWNGSAVATPTIAGVPEVDITHIGGTAPPAQNLQLMYDGSGYAGGTTKLQVNAVAISSDTAAADNLEAAYDGTGYAGGTIKQDVNVTAISGDTTSADNLESYTDGTTPMPVNATQISGDAVAADNCELFFDGAGYAGGTTKLIVNSDLIADAVWDEAASGHVASGSFGQAMNIVRAGTAQAGAAATITLDASASAVDSFYNNNLIVITGGLGIGQARFISGYVGATKVATVPAWITTPDATSVFVIIPFGSIPGATAPTAADNAVAVWNKLRADHVAVGSFGERVNADAVMISGDATSADNLEAFTDGTGYAGGTIKLVVASTLDASERNAIADQVWDELRSGHVNAGSFGEYVPADATRISGDATAADNLELFFDGTGYSAGNSGIGTITTYTGNTPQTGDSYARLGAAGAGLTALGDTRIANLDATISSRTKPADTQARVTLVDTVTTYTGNTPQTGDSFAVVNHASHGNAKLVRSTTPANTLDVSATGEAGLDFDNIKQATGATTLNNVTVPIVTSVTNRVTANADQIEGVDATDQLVTAINARVVAYGLDHLVSLAVTGPDIADNSIIAKLAASGATADWDTFDNTTDSHQALRDRGDAAWTTGSGGDGSAAIAAAVWDRAKVGHATAGTFGESLQSTVASRSTFNRATETVTVGTNSDKTGYAMSTAGNDAVIDGVWDESRASHVAAGSFGQGAASVQGNVTGSVASVTAGVTVTTNNDKTGYALSAAGVLAIWDALTASMLIAGSIGKKLKDWVLGADNKAVLSSDAHTGAVIPAVTTVTTVTNDVGVTQAGADKAWGTLSRTITGGTITTNSDKTGYTASTVSDKTGYALSASGLDTISTTAPIGVASNFREMVVATWRRFFKKSTLTATQLKTYADNGTTVLTTQVVSDDGTTQTQGSSS